MITTGINLVNFMEKNCAGFPYVVYKGCRVGR